MPKKNTKAQRAYEASLVPVKLNTSQRRIIERLADAVIERKVQRIRNLLKARTTKMLADVERGDKNLCEDSKEIVRELAECEKEMLVEKEDATFAQKFFSDDSFLGQYMSEKGIEGYFTFGEDLDDDDTDDINLY